MKNFGNTIWQKRLPSVMGLFVMLFAVGTIGWLSRNAILLGTRAATGGVPHNIQISNITDTAFTVSYTTDEKVLGSVAYGTEKTGGAIALDDRDQTTGTPKEYNIHYITVKNLTPSTRYYYIITSGDQTISNNTTPLEVTTGPKLDATKSTQPQLAGTINLEDGSIPTEAIVYASSSASQLFSSLVSADGSYKMELNTMRTANLSELMPFTKDTILRLTIMSPTLMSQVSLLASQSNPVPLVLLAKDYDFAVNPDGLSSSASSSGTASDSAQQDFPEIDDSTSTEPQILSPKADQEFKDQQPLFKGTAAPNEAVFITIASEQEIKATVEADDKGKWQYRPDEALEPGEHTITIETTTLDGIIKKISQPFTVYAAGSSAFTEPSISPSLGLSPTASVAPSPTTIQTPTPSASPSATPTLLPSPTASISPTLMQPLAPTGTNSVVMTLIGITSAIGIGALLFFFTMI